MNVDNLKKILSVIVAIVTSIGIILTICFSLDKYTKNNSLNLVEHYSSSATFESRMNIESVWRKNKETLVIEIKRLKDPKAVARFYNDLVLSLVKENDLHNDLALVSEFYEKTAICVDSGLCHEKTITNYFSRNGRIFLNRFYPYMCALRNFWEDPSIWQTIQKQYKPNSIGKNICSTSKK